VWVRAATDRPETKVLLNREEEPASQRRALYPGDELVEHVRLTKKVGGKMRLEGRVPFLAVSPDVVGARARDLRLELRFASPYAGEYVGRDVGIELTSPLGFFSSGVSIPLSLRYTVYPRLVSVAAATTTLLGKGEVGETPIEMPGSGSEFYEMRAYQPGDDFRSVNWNATARQGTLMVNEHMREVGASFLLVLDARAPGFRDLDRLASTFLLLANGLASAGVEFGVLVHDGREVTALSPEYDPKASLTAAFGAAVRVTKLDQDPEFLELHPARARAMLREDGSLERSPIFRMSDLRRARLTSVVKEADPWATASGYIRDRSTRSVICVSGLFADLEPLHELAWQARHIRDVDFSVANPCEPWVSAETDEARRLHSGYDRLAASLVGSGIMYYRGEPLGLARRILSA
jgi:uncharacterized protein (DUF58 family)